MKSQRPTVLVSLVAAAAMASVAHGQVALFALTGGGNATPVTISNATGAAYYIGAANGRWRLYGGALTFQSIPSSGGGRISADGTFQTCMVPNNGLITGQAASGISPAWSIPASTTTTALPTNNLIAARYSTVTSALTPLPGIPNDAYGHTGPAGGPADFQCYGSGDSGSVTTPMCISENGRFIGMQSYISTYASNGLSIVATNSFRTRPAVWDAATNTTRLLPTPYRTSTQTTRRRDGSVFAVSNDASVIVGAQEPSNAGITNNTDPDGARLVVWRWNGTDYSMSFLPNGANANGYPYEITYSAGSVTMNAAGNVIVGTAISNSGTTFIGKWTWNGASWDGPFNLGANVNPTLSITSIAGTGSVTVTTSVPHGLASNDWVYISGSSVASYNGLWQVAGSEEPYSFSIWASPVGDATGGTANKAASWLPSYIHTNDPASCPVNFPALRVTGMSADGTVIVGSATYAPNSCDGTHNAAQAGWIWTAATGYMQDWYDHLVSTGVANLGVGETWGPQSYDSPPLLAGPRSISANGDAFTGAYTLTVGAQPWVLAPVHICGTADFNCDGDVGTDADIESFFACLAGSCPAAPCLNTADFNGDGDVGTDADIEAFFRILAGGAC